MTDKIDLNIPKKYAIRLKTNALDFDAIVEDMCNEINELNGKLTQTKARMQIIYNEFNNPEYLDMFKTWFDEDGIPK